MAGYRKLPDDETLLQLLAAGMTNRTIGERYGTTGEAFRQALTRVPADLVDAARVDGDAIRLKRRTAATYRPRVRAPRRVPARREDAIMRARQALALAEQSLRNAADDQLKLADRLAAIFDELGTVA